MKRSLALVGVLLLLCAAVSRADEYTDTVKLFRDAGQSNSFFHRCYGYAVFPTVGKGGFVVGGAYGRGRGYLKSGKYVGDASIGELSVGFQAGGQAYSMILFLQDKRAFDDFTNGSFEFGADAGAVAITAAAGASAGTSGASASASGGMKDAVTAGKYYKGMAVFTIVKGGAMYEATIAGMKFNYKPRGG